MGVMGKVQWARAQRLGIHLWVMCWCGSGHSWEKAKHGTVDGRTEAEILNLISP